ncbi:MAG: ATP-binding protein [Nitrosomonas sp.]|nr:ATP-binding protein [Nitrosomonas sp.]
MSIIRLAEDTLSVNIDPKTLDFTDTASLIDQPLSWIGQERARQSAYFGLSMQQSDYNLFVLGETGSGRSSLLKQAMADVAAGMPVPSDLCFIFNFDIPEHPLAMRLPAGQGGLLQQALDHFIGEICREIPECLNGEAVRGESERINQKFGQEEAEAYARLCVFAEKLNFCIQREADRFVLTVLDKRSGKSLPEDEMLRLPAMEKVAIEQNEAVLYGEIADYLEKMHSLEHKREEALNTLWQTRIQPVLVQKLTAVLDSLHQSFPDRIKVEQYLHGIQKNILENLALFSSSESENEKSSLILKELLANYQINLAVDNRNLYGAPVLIEEHPSFKSLIGSIEHRVAEGVLISDFTGIRAGSWLKAHEGFLMLYLDDLFADESLWEKISGLLRSHLLLIEVPSSTTAGMPMISIEPEMITVQVKIVLIGSREQYYAIQEEDPEFARRFRVKVDFAASFVASLQTYHALSIFIASLCQTSKLPHFSTTAVVDVLKNCHREVEDQKRLTANFSRTETLILESASQCMARGGETVEATDVSSALHARFLRHGYPLTCALEAIIDGDVVIDVTGETVGQINGLSLVEMGDLAFGLPMRITAHAFAGEEGLLNIEREVGLSGPVHDKGVFILQNLLCALFHHNAPLAFNASIVFEQQYHGIEGDSASCAELYALLSALSGLPLRQSIAVTGAINQFGEILPVGGINEKIEGFYRVCAAIGLDGNQGVLIPERNRRHLMLTKEVIDAVQQEAFHIYSTEQMADGLEILTGVPSGLMCGISLNETLIYEPHTVLGQVQKTLRHFRSACQQPTHAKPGGKRMHERSGK